MMNYTHAAFAYLCSLVITNFLGNDNKARFIAVAVLAALLVDLDHAASWVGKKLEPISITIRLLFRHRNFFHSITAALITYLIIYAINTEVALAALVGYASHIFIDAFNTTGVRILSPFSKYRLGGCVKTGGMIDHLLFLISISGIICINL